MDSYYDSDDEVAWGPLTLKEIKKEFEQEPKKIDHRQTDLGCYTSSFLEMNPVVADKVPENTKSNTSGTSSYFTPNESFQSECATNKNDLFLEKLSKVIEGDGKEELEDSLYVSALSKQKPVNDTIMRILNCEERCSNNLDNIHQTLVELSPCQDKMEFFRENSTIEEHLNQDSYSDSEDDIIVITDDSSDESVEYVYEPVQNIVKHERCSRIPEIIPEEESKENQHFDSDSSEDIAELVLELNKIREKQKSLSMNAELDASGNGECQGEETENSRCLQIDNNLSQKDCENVAENVNITSSEQEVSITEEKSNLQRNEENVTLDFEEKVQSFIETDQYTSPHKNLQIEENEETDPLKSPSVEEEVIDKLEYIKLNPYTMNISGIGCLSNYSQLTTPNDKNYDDLKAVCVPENSVASTTSCENSSNIGSNDSAMLEHTEDKNESLVFNDTLEEMNIALQQGLNYIVQDNNVSEETKTDIDTELATNTEPGVKKKVLKPSSLKKFDYITSPIGNYIRSQKSPSTDNFKLPHKPVKSKIPRSPLVQAKQFKNIISPVSIYIKNSPGVCLKQNIPVKTVPSIQKYAVSNEAVKNNKENVAAELPPVIYRPPKKTIAASKKDVVLPPSIQKLVPEPVVIKHEKRIKPEMNSTAISRKLLEEDLTAIDSSLLSQSNDVSFVTKKQAFIK